MKSQLKVNVTMIGKPSKENLEKALTTLITEIKEKK